MPIPYEFIVKKRAEFFEALDINPEEYERCLEIADRYGINDKVLERFVLKLLDKALKELEKETSPSYVPRKISPSWTFIAALRWEIWQRETENVEKLQKALREVKELYKTFNSLGEPSDNP